MRLIGASSNHNKKITVEDWQKRITDTTGLTSKDEIQATYEGLVTLFPKMEHPVGMIRPGRRETLRVSDRDYFHRYFAFRIPTDDVSDETVRTEYKHLLDHGTWPSESTVLECLTDPGLNALVRTKLGMNGDLVADATSAQCASALVEITTHLEPGGKGLGFTHWGTVLYPILLRAICTAATPTEAEQIITTYRDTCGLIAITRVLAPPPYTPSADDLAKLTQATTTLRDEVCDLVVHDLTTDRPQDQRHQSSVLTFLDYLDQTEMWPQVRERIDPMLDSEVLTQGDLAARFVATYSDRHHTFHQQQFEKLVPLASWRPDQFPEDDNSSPLQEDNTFESLAMLAARAVRPILEAQQSETTG